MTPLQQYIQFVLNSKEFSDFMDTHYKPEAKKKYYDKLKKQLKAIDKMV